jgi:hypothetical protein
VWRRPEIKRCYNALTVFRTKKKDVLLLDKQNHRKIWAIRINLWHVGNNTFEFPNFKCVRYCWWQQIISEGHNLGIQLWLAFLEINIKNREIIINTSLYTHHTEAPIVRIRSEYNEPES